MSSLFKNPSQWEKDLVVGYHKEAQILVQPIQIPSEITKLCLDYYHEHDYFYQCKDPHRMQISDGQDTVTVIQNAGSYVCGAMYIGGDGQFLPMIYLWTFQIYNRGAIDESWLTSIGITNAENEDENEVFDGMDDSYRFASDGEILQCDEEDDYWTPYVEGGFNNDIIQMRIDICAGSISYQINGKDKGIAFKRIDFTKRYRMILYAGNNDECVKLINFKRILVRES